ncbi:hypothetical protein [Bacillus sp. JCM 19034]|uniref:hypothetical protein n=1 Tax=Bacillus sp. JCM 19034 TaxID=1481928 RepID=UPI0007858F38|nr:hypothetical protein [Bacillus sp. JCM 19034]
MRNIVIIGSEGTIGRAVTSMFKDDFQILIDKSFKEEFSEDNKSLKFSYDITSEAGVNKIYQMLNEKRGV